MKYVGMQTQIRRNNRLSVLLLLLFPVIILGMVWVFLALLNYFGNGYYNQYGELVHSLDVETVNYYFVTTIPWVILGVAVWFGIAYFMNANNYSNSTVENVLDNADSYLYENVVCSFTDEEIENNLYAQLAHLEYNGKIDYKTVMDGLESVQSDDGGFYNSVHLTSLAVRLLNDMNFDNAVHIYDLQSAVSPQNGYFGKDIEVNVNYAAAYAATMDTDCTVKLTVKNGKSVIYQKEDTLTLSENSTSVSGEFESFVINQMNDDGITVTTELFDGEKLLKSSQHNITLEEVPVAGSTELNSFTLTLDNYSAYEGYPVHVKSECELLYATNVQNSVDIRYTLSK